MRHKNPKKLIICECGRKYTANTARTHIKSKKCTASKDYKNLVFKYTEFSRTYRFAWDKRLGLEAKLFLWVGLVLNKEIEFTDLRFECPRPNHVCSPSALKRSSENKSNNKNPMSAENIYGTEYLENEIVHLYKAYIAKPTQWDVGIAKHIGDTLDTSHPKWSIGLILKDGNNKNASKNRKITIILRKKTHDFEVNFKKIRGVLISKGQKASPTCVAQAQLSAIQNGKRRTTMPQKRLHKLIQEIDPNSVLEFPVKNKLYDIYSKKFNLLVEMHGRIWHDLKGTPASLRDMVAKNVHNDAVKVDIAASEGYNLLTFWDDEEKHWQKQLGDWVLQCEN